jgi:hypothetical protein
MAEYFSQCGHIRGFCTSLKRMAYDTPNNPNNINEQTYNRRHKGTRQVIEGQLCAIPPRPLHLVYCPFLLQ